MVKAEENVHQNVTRIEHNPRSASASISKKALSIIRTPKKDRAEKFGNIFRKLPKAKYDKEVLPLYRQIWFRKMVDRLISGERIYEGRARYLGLYENESVVCDHKLCRHREAFHAREISSSSGHISKRKVYLHFGTTGKVTCMQLKEGF